MQIPNQTSYSNINWITTFYNCNAIVERLIIQTNNARFPFDNNQITLYSIWD